MGRIITTQFLLFLSAISLFMPIITGCTSIAKRGEVFHAGKCSEYDTCQIKDDLHLATEAFQDKQLIAKYFGSDLAEKGIIPLLVIAENHNTKSSFLLPNDNVEVVRLQNGKTKTANQRQDGKLLTLESAQSTIYDEAGKDLVKEFLGGGIILYQVAFVNLGPTEESAALQQELAVKALAKKTLSPGKKLSGFIYFGVPRVIDLDIQLLVSLKALNLQSRAVEIFSFPVTIKKTN